MPKTKYKVKRITNDTKTYKFYIRRGIMFKKLLVFTLGILFLTTQAVQACWAFFSIEELIEKSDVILIGKIQGKAGQSKNQDGMAETYWNVKVGYYLKGESDTKYYIVATPGAKSLFNSVVTSADYELADEKYALFFLSNNRPITPRGVAYLDVKDEENFFNNSSEVDISKLISNISPQSSEEENEKIMNFIKTSNITIPTVDNKIDDANSKDKMILLAFLKFLMKRFVNINL